MSKRKAVEDAYSSNSENEIRSASNENQSLDSEAFGKICMDAEILEIDDTIVVEADEEKCAKFSKVLHLAKSGVDIIESMKMLSNSGQKFGLSLTMNRIVKTLGSLKLINQEDSSCKWGKESKSTKLKSFKDKIEKTITELKFGSTQWSTVTKSILEGFDVDKKQKKRVVELVPFSSVSQLSNGRVCDRVALLACAIADPDLIQYWQHLAKPIEAKARPGMNRVESIFCNIPHHVTI